MSLHLNLSAYWLLVPVALTLIGLVAYKTRDYGGGPGDALGFVLLAGAALFAFLIILIGIMAYHLLFAA